VAPRKRDVAFSANRAGALERHALLGAQQMEGFFMRNKSFGKLRLIKCEEPDWLDLLSRANPRELNGSTSGGATHREDLIRAVMARNPNLTYERAAEEIDLFG
jgi:hypothetical protein